METDKGLFESVGDILNEKTTPVQLMKAAIRYQVKNKGKNPFRTAKNLTKPNKFPEESYNKVVAALKSLTAKWKGKTSLTCKITSRTYAILKAFPNNAIIAYTIDISDPDESNKFKEFGKDLRYKYEGMDIGKYTRVRVYRSPKDSYTHYDIVFQKTKPVAE